MPGRNEGESTETRPVVPTQVASGPARMTRRAFLRAAAVGATVAAGSALSACLPDATPKKATPVAGPPSEAGPTPAPGIADQIRGLVDKKIAEVQGTTPEKLAEEALKKLGKAAEINQKQGPLGDTEVPAQTRNDLAVEYEKGFQEGKTSSTPWQVDQYDVMVLVVLDGPGWWASVPRFRQYMESLADRPITDQEMVTFQKDRSAAISFLQDLYDKGKISKETLDFYSLPQTEAEAAVNKMFPNLLSSRK